MRLRDIDAGDRIELDIRGVVFAATVRRTGKGYVYFTPDNPKRYTWTSCSARRVKRKLERPTQLEESVRSVAQRAGVEG